MTRAAYIAVAALLAIATPARADSSSCVEEKTAVTASSKPPDISWKEFEVAGRLTESKETVRGLLAPTVNRHAPSLTDEGRADLIQTAAAFGYELVAFSTRETPTGTLLIIQLDPLPLVRVVDRPTIKVRGGLATKLFGRQFDDDIIRRLHVRAGTYLPWKLHDRECEFDEERQYVETFLRDEGYFEATAHVTEEPDGPGVRIHVAVDLGPVYKTGTVTISNPGALAVDQDQIKAAFVHESCIFGEHGCLSAFGYRPFTAVRHKQDIHKVEDMFKKVGFPSVRVLSDYNPATSFDRRTKTVSFTLEIDQRRHVDVVFEGNDDSIPDNQLRDQLTFNANGSADDVEVDASAKAITSFLQERGHFDAHVTWTRERFPELDRIIYRIDQGGTREVKAISFVGNRAIDHDKLGDAIATHAAQFTASLFGGSAAASSTQLAADTGRIADAYKREGYRDTHVRVSVASEVGALDSAAFTAAMVSAERGDGDLFVRFTVDEGPPTLVDDIEIVIDGGDSTLCDEAVKALAETLADKKEAAVKRLLGLPGGRCVARPINVMYREEVIEKSKDHLRDHFWSTGRPRAKVVVTPTNVASSLHGFLLLAVGERVTLHYTVSDTQQLKIGEVVLRGNFHTRDSVIRREILDYLSFVEGKPLTTDVLAEAARQLRATSLFDSVNIDLPNLDQTTEGKVNAIVRVQERYDRLATIDLELGYSSYNGLFTRLGPSFKNLFGTGLSLDVSGTVGIDVVKTYDLDSLTLKQLSLEGTFKVPSYVVRDYLPFNPNWAPQLELIAYRRLQDTPRFGPVTTEGATLAGSHTWSRQRTETQTARAITIGGHYDFRRLERQVDVLRPLGADNDDTQAPITTLTGLFGVTAEYEQRVDREGALQPLAPEAGMRLEGQIAWADKYFFGQDNFIKVSASGSKYWPVGNNLVVRYDLRYDQGFPLGDAVLLPEVERFFAGGDATVRGYDDDRLATEILKVGVPPLQNVQQLRILPAGGNIRVMTSLDLQLRIYKFLATAVFSDAGLVTNEWSAVAARDIRPSVGVALVRVVTQFGVFAVERAVPIHPELGDDPRGRWHISFAARAQF